MKEEGKLLDCLHCEKKKRFSHIVNLRHSKYSSVGKLKYDRLFMKDMLDGDSLSMTKCCHYCEVILKSFPATSLLKLRSCHPPPNTHTHTHTVLSTGLSTAS